jgi:hypothetical protein
MSDKPSDYMKTALCFVVAIIVAIVLIRIFPDKNAPMFGSATIEGECLKQSTLDRHTTIPA